MPSLSGLARAREWWSYKIPPLLAIAYALMLLTGGDPRMAAARLAATVTSIIAVAAYGYVINDCFDIESDQRAGKVNRMAGLAVWQRAGIVTTILFLGWSPAAWVGYSTIACVLLAIDFLLPTIYSMPPIRLKERGILGVLSDASAAHLIPTLFLSAVFFSSPDARTSQSLLFASVAAAWYSIVGLRGILNHQILDREADIASGVTTMVTAMDTVRALKWTRTVFYTLEMAAFTLFVASLAAAGWVIVPIVVLAAVLELAKRLFGWEEAYVVSSGVDRTLRAYLPFANNVFYNLWLPVVLCVEVAIRFPVLAWLPVLHVLLFGARLKDEWREPAALFQHVRREWKLWRIRQKWGWRIYTDDRLIPRFSWTKERAVRIEPTAAGGDPWSVRLVGNSVPIAHGAAYQLRVRMRADAPREVVVGVCGLRSPWPELGLTRRISLGRDFESFLFDFRASGTREEAGVFLLLGESEEAVEVEEARLYCVTAPGPWTLLSEPGVPARRTATRNPSALVRIDRLSASPEAWNVLLLSGEIAGGLGNIVRVFLSIQAERARKVYFGIAGTVEPFDVVGRPQRVALSPVVRDVFGEFLVDRQGPLCVFFWLGCDASAVEILNLETEVVRDGRFWTIDAHESCEVVRLLPTSLITTLVDVRAIDGIAEHAVLSTPLPGGNGPRQVWIEMRAGTTRPAKLGVERRPGGEQASSPAYLVPQSLSIEVIQVTESWHGYLVEYVAVPGSREVLFVWLGEADGTVEIGEVRTGPTPTEVAWRLDSGDRDFRRSVPNGLAKVERVERVGPVAANDPWKARLVGAATQACDSRWRLTLRMRGEGGGRVTFGICEAHEPWRPLAEMNTLELDADWKDCVIDAPASVAQAMPVIWLGQMGSAFEMERASFAALPAAQVWRLATSDGTVAHRAPVIDSRNAARVVIGRAGAHEYDVTLSCSLGPVESGATYRLCLTLESERRRGVGVVLDEGTPPWRTLGGPSRIFVDSSRKEHAWDFVAVASAAAGRLALWLGGDNSAIEVGPFELVHIDPADAWSLDLADGCAASRSLDRQTRAQRIEVSQTHGYPWNVQLTALDSKSGRLGYRMHFRLRGTADFRCQFGVRRPDGQSLGSVHSVLAGSEWQTVLADCPVESSEHPVAAFFWLGANKGHVELCDIQVHPIHDGFLWRVEGAKASAARLAPLPSFPQGLAIEIGPDTNDPWDVKLTGVDACVQEGRAYQLRCRIRSSISRSALVGVLEAESPWADVGLLQPISVEENWRTVVEEFVATKDAARAAVVLLLGGAECRVELAEVRLIEIDASRMISITAPAGAVRRLGVEGADDVTRLELTATDDPWRVKVTCLRLAVRASSVFRLAIDLRSDQAREVIVVAAQNHAPWESLGLLRTISIDPVWRRWVFDFVATRDEDEAAVFVCVGGSATAVEIGLTEAHEIDPERVWRLEAPAGAAVCLAPLDEPDAMRVEIWRATEHAWQVKLASSSFSLMDQARCRVSGRLRADRERSVSICVAQAHPPWRELGLFRRLALSTDWREWSQEFTAKSEDPEARFFVWLGEAEGAVDLADFRWEVEPAEAFPPEPALSGQQQGRRDEEIDRDADNIDQTGNERAGAVGGIHAQPQEKEGQL